MPLNSAYTQIVIVGLVALCCPGLFNALSGLGKGGAKNADAANSANATLYACFAVFGYFGGPLFNIFGNKILMCVGGLTYAFYAAGMYIAGYVDGTGWVAILSGALLGIGAGLFWTSQGAMMLSYATPERQGTYIAVFWAIFNVGGMAGGLLSFFINFKNGDSNQANPASYFTFVGLMALGAIGSAFLLVHPGRVTKEDGQLVEIAPAKPACEEIKGALAVATNKYMLCLTLFFVSTNWNYTWQFNYVNGGLFNIRTRGFNSAIYWGMQMLSAWIMGWILDNTKYSRRRRAMAGFVLSMLLFAISYVLGFLIQFVFEEHWDKPNLDLIVPIDIVDSKRAVLPIISLCIFGLADAAMQAFAYWIMGAVAGDDLALAANFSGYYKGVQSVGAAVAWGLDLKLNFGPQLWAAFAIWIVGMFLSIVAVRDVKEIETPVEKIAVTAAQEPLEESP